MIQRCTADYWTAAPQVLERNGDLNNPGQPCGRVFDDVDRSTICPHEPLGAEGLVCRDTDLYRSICTCPKCRPPVAPPPSST